MLPIFLILILQLITGLLQNQTLHTAHYKQQQSMSISNEASPRI